MKLYKYQLPGKMNTAGSLFARNSLEAREKISEIHGETESLRLPIGTKIWEERLSGNAKKSINEIIGKSMLLAKKGKKTRKRNTRKRNTRKRNTRKRNTTKKTGKKTRKSDVSPST